MSMPTPHIIRMVCQGTLARAFFSSPIFKIIPTMARITARKVMSSLPAKAAMAALPVIPLRTLGTTMMRSIRRMSAMVVICFRLKGSGLSILLGLALKPRKMK